MKVINDAIHGQFKLDGVTKDLLSTPEMNKLSHIKQLGLAHLVFPGAHHTRFEHSLGASHIAGRMAESLSMDDLDKGIYTFLRVLGEFWRVFQRIRGDFFGGIFGDEKLYKKMTEVL